MALPTPIPDPSRIKDPETRRVLQAMMENLRIICGEAGPSDKHHVTRKELIDGGIAEDSNGRLVAPEGG